MGDITGGLTGTDLQLEMPVTAHLQHAFGFFNVPAGVAAGQCPGHFHTVAHASAKQFGNRQPKALALSIEQRRFNRRTRERVAANATVDALHQRVEVGGVLPDKERSEPLVEVHLDAFRALSGIRQASDGGGLTDAGNAVAAPNAQDDQGLTLQGMHGQLVRANRRQVDDQGVETFDGNGSHGESVCCVIVLEQRLASGRPVKRCCRRISRSTNARLPASARAASP